MVKEKGSDTNVAADLEEQLAQERKASSGKDKKITLTPDQVSDCPIHTVGIIPIKFDRLSLQS